MPGRKCCGRGKAFGPADDQRDVQPLLVAELLAADVGLAVVAVKTTIVLSARPSASSCSRIRPTLRSSSVAASRYLAQSSRVTGWSG